MEKRNEVKYDNFNNIGHVTYSAIIYGVSTVDGIWGTVSHPPSGGRMLKCAKNF